MAYNSTVFDIMIASPNDVEAESNALQEIIQQWNYTHSRHRNLVLIPRSWKSSSAPETAGRRPQESINEIILDQSDILVAIFWKKVGTPTGEFNSGTIEEIEKHVDAGKPTMIYFSSANIPQGHDEEQLKMVKEFKNECKTEGSKYNGLFWDFANINELKDYFKEHLDIVLHNNRYLQLAKKASTVQSFAEAIETPFTMTQEETITLIETAKNILIEACQDPEGRIDQRDFVGGLLVQTNGKQFDAMNDGRKEAELKKAISQLESVGFIESEGYERTLFKVTMDGYEYYDKFLKKE